MKEESLLMIDHLARLVLHVCQFIYHCPGGRKLPAK
jgi:hypothetical protein